MGLQPIACAREVKSFDKGPLAWQVSSLFNIWLHQLNNSNYAAQLFFSSRVPISIRVSCARMARQYGGDQVIPLALNKNVQVSISRVRWSFTQRLVGWAAEAQASPFTSRTLWSNVPSSRPRFCILKNKYFYCLLYTSPSPRDATLSRMPSSA